MLISLSQRDGIYSQHALCKAVVSGIYLCRRASHQDPIYVRRRCFAWVTCAEGRSWERKSIKVWCHQLCPWHSQTSLRGYRCGDVINPVPQIERCLRDAHRPYNGMDSYELAFVLRNSLCQFSFVPVEVDGELWAINVQSPLIWSPPDDGVWNGIANLLLSSRLNGDPVANAEYGYRNDHRDSHSLMTVKAACSGGNHQARRQTTSALLCYNANLLREQAAARTPSQVAVAVIRTARMPNLQVQG